MWTPPSRASKLSVQDGSSDQVQSYVRLLDAIMTCVLDREPVWFTCISSISFARAQRHSAFYWFCRWHLADSFSPSLSSVLLTHDRWVPHATSIPLSHLSNGTGTVPYADAVLPWRDPDPGGKFPAVSEVRHVRGIGGQRKRRDGYGAGNRHQAFGVFPRIQREARRLGHRAVMILEHPSQATDVRHALGGRYAVLRQRTTVTIASF